MVSFICDACGNTVKKTQVEKHYSTVCRNCNVLSCLDCGVDFPGDSYVAHTSCVTEAEKYQGHLYQSKDKENKGETKQKEWLKSVHGTSNSTNDPKLRSLLKRLSAYSNIPRKKKKFENFCKNSVNVYDTKTLDQLWDLFTGTNEESNTTNESSECTKECKENVTSEPSNNNETTETVNGGDLEVDLDSQPMKKKKKRKQLCEENTIVNGEVTVAGDTNENGEPVTKTKKKKKKQVVNGETECNGESNDACADDCSMEDVENGLEHKTSKSKKKKKKQKQETAENEIEVQPTQKKSKKSKKKVGSVVENGQEDKKRKVGKKCKLKEESIELENVDVKKTKIEENGSIDCDTTVDTDEGPKGRFNWHKTIKTVLKESDDQELSVKKLRKKVLNAYQEHGVDHRASTMNECMALFDKKLKSYPKAKILKDHVKLVK